MMISCETGFLIQEYVKTHIQRMNYYRIKYKVKIDSTVSKYVVTYTNIKNNNQIEFHMCYMYLLHSDNKYLPILKYNRKNFFLSSTTFLFIFIPY